MQLTARELDFSTPQEVYPANGGPGIEFPFESNGDFWSFIVTRSFKQTVAGFIADRIAGRYKAGATADIEYPDAYLIATSIPVTTPTGLYSFQRAFARVPTTQTVATSVPMFRPAITGTVPQNVGNYRLFQPDPTVESYDAYERKAVASDSGAPSGNYPTGGTYTVALDGSATAATAFGAVAGTLQTNLNAVTKVSDRGNCVVTGAYNAAAGFLVTFNSYAALTTTLTSLTGTTGISVGSTISTASGGYSQSVRITPTGIDAGSPDVTDSTTGGTNVYKSVGGFGVVDPLAGAARYTWSLISVGTAISGGTYTLTLYGQTTAAIAYNANAATVQAAVNSALTNAAARGTVVIAFAGIVSINGYPGVNVEMLITPSLSGGTFTATIFGQTTAAVAYNASLATIQTRFNALSEVQTDRGGVIVSGDGFVNGVMSFTITFGNPLLVAATGSLTPAGSTMTVATADGGINRVQTITFNAVNNTRTFFVEGGHGISVSDTLMIRNASADYGGIAGTFTVPNGQTLSLTILPTDTYAAAATITEIGRLSKPAYQPGYSNVDASIVTDFYLPGVTPGIATASDIPRVASQSDNTSVLQAIFTGTATLNWEGSRLGKWTDSVILQRETTTINVIDI